MLLSISIRLFHDHYSLWDLQTTGSSTAIQLFKTYPHGNEGSLIFLVFGSSTPKCLIHIHGYSLSFVFNHLEIDEACWAKIEKTTQQGDFHLCIFHLFQKETCNSSFFSLPCTSLFLVYRACILNQIRPSRLLWLSSTCLVVFFQVYLQLGSFTCYLLQARLSGFKKPWHRYLQPLFYIHCIDKF